MIRRPPRSTLFPTRRSSDLDQNDRWIRIKNLIAKITTIFSNIKSPVRKIPFDQRREIRSEEHTSELQSRENLVCRLLLEKKKKKNKETQSTTKKAGRKQTQ